MAGDDRGRGNRSLWEATCPPAPAVTTSAAARLPRDVDVLIVGAGYTGLWTAQSLAAADPSLRIAVVDRERVGFGASGRNGGWCSALLPLGLDALASRHGREAAIAMQRAMFATVDAIGAFAAEQDPAGDGVLFHRGGTITLARTGRQRERVQQQVATMLSFGFGDDDVRLLSPGEAAVICNAAGTLAASFTPHCAAVHPLRLADAIATDARRRGVCIAEGVDVHELLPGSAATSEGTVRAEVIVLATEAFTVGLPGRRRDVLPLYSLMIGSTPLDDAAWDAVGLADRQTFADARHSVIYGQRTADGRLAFGGRGAPYHYGSRIEPGFDRDDRVRRHLERTVAELFPALRDATWEHHWGGPLGVARDWHPHVRFDRMTGLAGAGGYAGDGVAAANLAGRTLADLICGRDTDLTRLPWVGHRSRRWEPEPLRWLGVRLAAVAARRADEFDADGRRTAAAWDRLYRVFR